MKGSNKSGGAEMLGRLEDRAAKYLRDLPPAVAFATALEAEAYLAIKWAAEQNEMLRNGDTRKVFWIDDDDFQKMRWQEQWCQQTGGWTLKLCIAYSGQLTTCRPIKGGEWLTPSLFGRVSAACFQTVFRLGTLHQDWPIYDNSRTAIYLWARERPNAPKVYPAKFRPDATRTEDVEKLGVVGRRLERVEMDQTPYPDFRLWGEHDKT